MRKDNKDLLQQLQQKFEETYDLCKEISKEIEATKDEQLQTQMIIECGKLMDEHFKRMASI